MYLVRLLSAAFLLSSLFALAQEHTSPTSQPLITPRFEFKAPAANAAEPWRIIPRQWQSSGSNSEEASLGGLPGIALGPHGHATRRATVLTGPDDDVCYTMRTYVVARDSKDSDSTHHVRATTCLPGSRLRLKTADAAADFKLR